MRSRVQSLKEKAAAVLGVPSSEVVQRSESLEKRFSKNPSLDIRSEFKTVCSAMSHKRTEFGKYAKTRIMRAAGAMDKQDAAPWHYLFFTATLPGNTEWAKWAIAEEAPWIINTFKAWLSKRVKSRYEFYVWEHQDRGALHFHYCVYCPNKEIRERLNAEFRLEWMRLLQGVSERTGINVWGRHSHLSDTAKYCILQTTVQEVNKSVAAYMAGYCGLKKDKHQKDTSIPYYPKRWFGVSRHLSTLVSDSTEEEIIQYSDYRDAKLSFDEFTRHFSDSSIKTTTFCHTVGTGETSVNYHTPKIQAQLWQLKKTMQYKKATHPNTCSIIRLALAVASTCGELEIGSQLYRKSVSSWSRDVLQDSLYKDSLRRGSLRDVTVKAISDLMLDLGSNSSLPPSLQKLLKSARLFCLVHSANYPKMKWNRYGYLMTPEDLPFSVDSMREESHTRTTSDEDGTPGGELAPRAHVANDADPPIQLQMF